jgi:CheY-like chemotaxis protein
LTLILGPIQSLRDNTDNPDVTRQLNMMERNAQRLLGLIDQLLHLSKLESAKIELFSGRQDIIILIRGNVMNFSSLAASRKIGLSIKTHLHSLVMDFDKEKMETVFINLLSNAFKFTPDRGFIEVSVEKEESEKEKNLIIRVQDSGAGILEKDIPYVFDRYYQGAEGQKLFRAGSGIGLAMVKELVQLHKGAIEIVSRHGEGTEIKITIPMGENYVLQELPVEEGSDILDKTTVIAAEKMAASKQEDEEKPIALVIEDNADVMRYLKDVLQKDYVVLSAENGEEGIAKALQEIPDLIISDVMMPKMDGYEVCDALKQDERTSHIPLILLTAKAGHEDKLQGLRKKADEYITKPFYPRELLLIAGNLIDSRKALQAKYRKELVLKPMNITIPSMEEAFLQRLMQIVEENMDEEGFTVEKLASEIGMSRSQLHRKLQALTNQSATEFIRYYRLSRAKEMLQHHVGTIAEIGYKVGFGSPSYFNKMFLQQYGITPGKIKAGQS